MREAQDTSGIVAAFSLVSFFWPRKRKKLSCRAETRRQYRLRIAFLNLRLSLNRTLPTHPRQGSGQRELKYLTDFSRINEAKQAQFNQ
jgi:hypothetical protein